MKEKILFPGRALNPDLKHQVQQRVNNWDTQDK